MFSQRRDTPHTLRVSLHDSFYNKLNWGSSPWKKKNNKMPFLYREGSLREAKGEKKASRCLGACLLQPTAIQRRDVRYSERRTVTSRQSQFLRKHHLIDYRITILDFCITVLLGIRLIISRLILIKVLQSTENAHAWIVPRMAFITNCSFDRSEMKTVLAWK